MRDSIPLKVPSHSLGLSTAWETLLGNEIKQHKHQLTQGTKKVPKSIKKSPAPWAYFCSLIFLITFNY